MRKASKRRDLSAPKAAAENPIAGYWWSRSSQPVPLGLQRLCSDLPKGNKIKNKSCRVFSPNLLLTASSIKKTS
ncbi:hypothetical protein NQZ79_g5305 [Umbelopsis isabellina]|nr:hypothetical protein NQZ79_g5305 [Umbelopsis isabellina]